MSRENEYKLGKGGYLRRGNPCRGCSFAEDKGGLFRGPVMGSGCEIRGLMEVVEKFGTWKSGVEVLDVAVKSGDEREVLRLLQLLEGSRPPIDWVPGRPETASRMTVIGALGHLAEEEGVRLCGVVFGREGVEVKLRKNKN